MELIGNARIRPVAVIEIVFFKSYPPNAYGHDFVVGDIHGHRQRLLDELARQGFDKEKDRLFCTGDLIDRGPDSFGTLALFFEPWFHCVRGNHEDDLPLFLEYHIRNPMMTVTGSRHGLGVSLPKTRTLTSLTGKMATVSKPIEWLAK